jgi:DNA replication factor GINS
MVFDFQRVKDVHYAEKNSNVLTRVEPDFYKQLRDFILEEREKLQEKMELSGAEIDPVLVQAYKNLVSIAKEIIVMRANKIVKAAVTDAFKSEGDVPEEAIDWERDLYYRVRSAVESAIRGVVGNGGRTFNLVRVRILTDIPLFVGPDLKEYGPFRAGEEVPLPKEVADILVKKGQAEVIG